MPKTKAPESLVPRLKMYGKNDLQDHLVVVASNIEAALLQSGAKPVRDYNRKDLIQLAMTYVVAEMRKGKEFKLNDGNDY